jgi:hypothetical protein
MVAAAALLLAGGCSYPTDQSVGMYVAVSAPNAVLLRGAVADVQARVWIRGDDGDSVEVRNAALVWSTSDPTLATIAANGATAGRVTGVNPGIVQIRAVAPGFEGAEAGVFDLRVANPLEIDSLTPDTVRYGQLLVAYGVGVGSLFFAGLGDGTLGIDSLAVSGDPLGLGARAFWVAYPVRSGTFFAAGSGQLVTAPESTVVLPFDVYEPNQTSPAVVALDGQPPYAGAEWIRFYNPALAFEDLRGAPVGWDWYRFTTADPTRPHTFLLVAPALRGTHGSYLTNDASPGANSWRLGPGNYDCKGFEFRPAVAPSDSLVVTLGALPAGFVDLVSAYAQQGRYALAVLEGYMTDPRWPPDRFEENDLCDFADLNFTDPAKRIDLGQPFAETLTIDTPHEIDWLRFRVPGAVAQLVTVATAGRPLGGTGDRSDIDLYLLRAATASQGVSLVGGNADPGSASTTTVLLEPGDYYAAVVDSAGMPTHYAICMAVGTQCTLPPATASADVALPSPMRRVPGMRPVSP